MEKLIVPFSRTAAWTIVALCVFMLANAASLVM